MSETATREYAPHQQRVVDEANELRDKFLKLSAFVNSENEIYQGLEEEEKQDLLEQHTLMGRYLLILDRRISRF